MQDVLHPRLDILPPEQQALWPRLVEVPARFTLYDGTAIALHLGHRQSVDFDFFAFEDIDPDALLDELGFLSGSRVIAAARNTLTVLAGEMQAVACSFFGLPRVRALQPRLRADGNGLGVASLTDLAATKIMVVQKRAEAKDYLDIAALIEAGVGLDKAISAAKELYGPAFSALSSLKALTYFADGNLISLPGSVRAQLTAAARAVDLVRIAGQ